MKFIILFLFTTPALCHEWVRSEKKFDFIAENLVYSNRAQCALRSKYPTRQVFLMVDNVNIAKAAYRLAKLKGIDPEETTKLSVEKFRYGLTKLTSDIGRGLLSGALPLIDPKNFSDETVQKNWENRKIISKDGKLVCRNVKKFGSLHSTLNVSTPDHFLLKEIGEDLEKLGDSFGSCEDFTEDSFSDLALYRFDIYSDSSFEKSGFRFWSSLKVYLAWVLRFSSEMKGLTAPFDSLLQSADIEEMILFLSAGCESISTPECSDQDLSLNSLQELTAPMKEIDIQESNNYRPVSEPGIGQLISTPLPIKEDDLLHLNSFSSSAEWLENFQENFLRARGLQKIRLSRALANLHILSLSTSSSELKRELQREVLEDRKEWKQEAFYLCTEFGGASKTLFSSLEKDLELLQKSHLFKETFQGIDGATLEQMVNLYKDLSGLVNELCLELEEKKNWEDAEIDRKGLASWYLQISGSAPVLHRTNLSSSPSIGGSLIKINETEIFCQSGIHCARILLDSLMTLSNASRFLPTVTPPEVIPSANLGNPYASRVACGIYDPWQKRNKMIYNFFHDLVQSAAFGLLPSPVYVSVDIDPKKVSSFSTLLKEGKVFYDPIYAPRKVHLSVISDLGPLLGVPCAISISGSRINPLEYYSFNGISFSGCKEDGKNDIRVSNEDEVKKDVSNRQICGTCAINLRTVSGAVARLNPVVKFSSFLLKGIIRLVHARRDPHDIPKSKTIKSQHVALSYRYWGDITPWCAKKILQGKSCLPKSCERKMLDELTAKYEVSPVSSTFSCFLNEGTVKVKECKEPLFLTLKGQLSLKANCNLKERI